jgi:secreted PhoX family phosphatase
MACTNGGVARLGQIWRYVPSPYEGTPEEATNPAVLELFIESEKGGVIQNCDNLTIAPWGDLFVCEDSAAGDGLVRIEPNGNVKRFAMHRGTTTELAGACVSPDGSTLFVNLQGPGLTMAITGPWRS